MRTNPLVCTCFAINLVLPLLKGGQFHLFLKAQEQNAVEFLLYLPMLEHTLKFTITTSLAH